MKETQRLTIGIPRVSVQPKGESNAGYRDFELDSRRWPRYAAVARDIVVQHLTQDAERYRLTADSGMAREKTLEDYLVTKLIDYEQISYDHTMRSCSTNWRGRR